MPFLPARAYLSGAGPTANSDDLASLLEIILDHVVDDPARVPIGRLKSRLAKHGTRRIRPVLGFERNVEGTSKPPPKCGSDRERHGCEEAAEYVLNEVAHFRPPNGSGAQLPGRENLSRQRPSLYAQGYHEFGPRWCPVSCSALLGGERRSPESARKPGLIEDRCRARGRIIWEDDQNAMLIGGSLRGGQTHPPFSRRVRHIHPKIRPEQ